MKTCVSSYSFGAYMNPDRLGLFGIIDKAAELGFEGIEFAEASWVNGYDFSLAQKIKEYVASKNMEVVAYCAGADFIHGCGGVLKDEIFRLRQITEFAAALGAKNMRHDVAGCGPVGKKVGISYDVMLPRLAEGCREVAKYAEQVGIGTMTENHGYYSQDSTRVEKLINETNHENFGALIDAGNFMCADEDPCEAVARMIPYCKHVHVKDFFWKSGMEVNPGNGWGTTRAGNYLRGTIVGHGDAKIYQSIQSLKRSGYDGFVSIEFEGMEDNLLGLQIGLENLKRFMS